tara:strand:- start:14 stop:307 length:294 start_codon:yes stop_codon:yes gene_type:complete
MDLKLNIFKIILCSLLLSSCIPLELYGEAPLFVKIIIFVFVILMLIGILVNNDLMPDIGSTDGLEIKDYKTNSQLNNIYWLLIIVIILLSIILWKIW